jgi:hypothetical protein
MALAVTALVAIGIVAGLLFAHRRGHLLAAALPTLLFLAFAWVLAKIAQDTDYRDADGWVDCWPSCSPVQHAVGITLWIAPLVAAVVIVAIVLAMGTRRPRDPRRG